jgi:hypothetical protein
MGVLTTLTVDCISLFYFHLEINFSDVETFVTDPEILWNICAPFNDLLRAGRPRDQSSSLGRIKNFHFPISSSPPIVHSTFYIFISSTDTFDWFCDVLLL